jgi:hypothetical protein
METKRRETTEPGNMKGGTMKLIKSTTDKRDDLILAMVGADPTEPTLVLSKAERTILLNAIVICEHANDLIPNEDFHGAELYLRAAIDFHD